MFVLLNRGDQFSLEPCLKLLKDLFSKQETADFFFLNDLHVLVDIIIRETNNVPENSKIRVEYLEVLYGLLKYHPTFSKECYKKNDQITKTLTNILDNYTPGDLTYSITEKIVMEIPGFS